MPAYSATGNRVSISNPGDSQVVWNAEKPATNSASQQLALGQSQAEDSISFSVELHFSGAPGTFSVTVQVADTDTANAYVTQGTSITTVTNTYALAQFTGIRANFVRLFMTDDPANDVTTTATITR